jgi:hypothetical protein
MTVETLGYRGGRFIFQSEIAFECTVADIVDAIEKNGLRQVHGTYVEVDTNGNPIAACAIGQAAVNLKVSHLSIFLALNTFRSSKRSSRLGDYIIALNDNHFDSFAEIARKVRAYYHPALKEKVTFTTHDVQRYQTEA